MPKTALIILLIDPNKSIFSISLLVTAKAHEKVHKKINNGLQIEQMFFFIRCLLKDIEDKFYNYVR